MRLSPIVRAALVEHILYVELQARRAELQPGAQIDMVDSDSSYCGLPAPAVTIPDGK